MSAELLVKVLGSAAVDAAGPNGPKIYCYASQAENFKTKAFSELRQRIAKLSDGATYTFSKDFISQTICVVDEDADRKQILAEKRSHWLTQTGFTYPRPKTLQDLITHPKRPSDGRIEELKEPYPDGPMHRASASPEAQSAVAEMLRLERDYTTRIRGGDDFGALVPPQYTRGFELKLVGGRGKLPRGLQTAGYPGDKVRSPPPLPTLPPKS